MSLSDGATLDKCIQWCNLNDVFCVDIIWREPRYCYRSIQWLIKWHFGNTPDHGARKCHRFITLSWPIFRKKILFLKNHKSELWKLCLDTIPFTKQPADVTKSKSLIWDWIYKAHECHWSSLTSGSWGFQAVIASNSHHTEPPLLRSRLYLY